MSPAVFSPLTLPNGVVIPNRLAKAAMEENMAGPKQLPDERLWRLYEAWAQGGAGLIITGNVMVDPRALTGPGGVVLQRGADLAPFKRWAQAARAGGAQVWMQINHPGRQVMAAMDQPGWAPSDVALDLGKHSKLIARPRAMTEAEILQTIARFADTAKLAEEAGFTGVEIHAAHGCLLSQFLSPLANRRADRWGGSLENRARFLMAVVRAVRAAVSKEFCVAVKLNSADFQRGGFDAVDAQAVVQEVLAQGVAMAGMATALAMNPALPRARRDGRPQDGTRPQVGLKDKVIAALATMAIVKRQLQRLGAGQTPKPQANAWFSLVRDQLRTRLLTRRYRRWMLLQQAI